MTRSIHYKDENIYKLFLFSFALAILTYGFALTNYTLTIDNEIPIYQDYGLDLGRWGQNLIRYYLFKGHLPYFSLILSLFLFSIAATRLAKLFKFQDIAAYCFCALFITFPQISYQVVFGMMADIAGLGVLLSVYCIELFQKALELKSNVKKGLLFLAVALLLMFTLSMYQAFIFVPVAIYLILFFQYTYDESFKLNEEFKKVLLFGGVILLSLVLYILSVKIICPATQDSSYLTAFVSGGDSDKNQFLEFCSIWFKNLMGSFYYGERMFIVVLISGLFLFVRVFIEKKHIAIRFATLFVILLTPFLMSSIITNGYHPPRLYLNSSLVFAFVIVFALNLLNITSSNVIKVGILLIIVVNIYFVTNLFYTANKIYKRDKKIAEKIDNIIQAKYPKFFTTDKSIYFYGYFPFQFHQDLMLDKSEIFAGSIYTWDNGNNYRIVNFFREADVAEYKMIDSKEKFDAIKDSITKMPIWPDSDCVKMFDNNVVVVKLGNEKGGPLYFE